MSVEQKKLKIGRPKDANPERTKINILRAAQEIFGKRGFALATVGDIANDAGVSTGSIYKYFGSKLDLYVASYEAAQKKILPRFIDAASRGDKFIDKLKDVNLEAGKMMYEDPVLGDFLLSSAIEIRRHPEIATHISEANNQILPQFNNFMQSTFDLDGIELDFPTAHLGVMFTGCMFGIGIMSLLYDDASVNELFEPYIQLMGRAIS